MVLVSFHLFSYTLLFFIIGMIKPKWALFFLKEPTRFLISGISIVAFMIAMTVYGEGHRQDALLAKKTAESATPVSELPEAKEEVKTENVKEKK